MKDIENLKRSLKSKDNPSQQKGLSTGSTLLNLACSGDPSYGLLPGHIYLLVGDSNAGKTWIAHSIFAEAANSPIYSKYRLIYDNPEDGALMDIERYFGKNTAKRIEPYHSETVEAFYYHIDKLKDAPFVYVLDSMDALSSESEESKFEEQCKAAEKGKETSGSYGTAKAKANAAGCRLALARIKKIGSIVIIICQTRANLGLAHSSTPRLAPGAWPCSSMPQSKCGCRSRNVLEGGFLVKIGSKASCLASRSSVLASRAESIPLKCQSITPAALTR